MAYYSWGGPHRGSTQLQDMLGYCKIIFLSLCKDENILYQNCKHALEWTLLTNRFDFIGFWDFPGVQKSKNHVYCSAVCWNLMGRGQWYLNPWQTCYIRTNGLKYVLLNLNMIFNPKTFANINMNLKVLDKGTFLIATLSRKVNDLNLTTRYFS